MKLGIRFKLFLVSVGLIAMGFAVADAYLTRGVERELTASVADDLSVRASLVAREAATMSAPMDDIDAWDALADRMGEAARARVTLVRRDGVVVGDSELDPAGVRAVENHGTRPEILAAYADGRGSSTRFSSTVHERMMYVAVPFTRDGPIAGVTRVAEPLQTVDIAIGHVRHLIAAASLLAIVIALFMSTFAAHWMSGAVRELTAAARRMTAGDLDVRTRVQTADELGELGRALDQMAGSLSETLDELTAERDLQRRILDGMEEGVLVLDEKGAIVMMNPALRAMLLLGADVAGKMLIEVVRHAELHDLLQRARRDKTTALGEIDLPGLKPRRLLAHVAALSGEAAGMLAVFVDVTDLRRLESLRRDFVANVSHELRTPVTAVLSAAETLKTGALADPNPEVAKRFVDIVERNAQRLQSLIEDLLELSRLESTELRLKKERVELPVVASIVLGLFRERAEKKGIKVRAEIPADVPVLLTDQRALEQVLSNLVDNAIKYCPAGATVTITARVEEGAIRIAVVDDGPGIHPRHVPRLFERFYRVDAGRSRELGGTGLGLSIVKHLVEAMGGVVTVESAVGKGSKFEVSLPRPA